MLDAQLIACKALDMARTTLFAHPETIISRTDVDVLNAMLARRIDGEPMAYITGTREFWSFELQVAAGTLVPRADTELLVEHALNLVTKAPQGYIVELGTGSGAIAIAIAHELPHRNVLAVESSARALHVAQHNIRAHTTGNVQLINASWLDSIANNSVAMVLANPPYLASNDPHLAQLEHEPYSALVSGNTGLEDLEHIIKETVRVAKAGAPLIVEHGCEQAIAVRTQLIDYGYIDVGTGLDLAGLERISFGLVAK